MPQLFPPSVTLVPWRVGREIRPAADWQAARSLRRVVSELRPDLVHAHSSKAGALARLALSLSGPPVFFSPHGYAFLRRDVSQRSRMAYRSIEWMLGRLPHLTVACGSNELVLAQKVARQATVIHNLVDFASLPPPRIEPSGNRLRVVMCGGIRPQKNFALFQAIAEAMLDRPVDFLWIGGGEVPANLPANLTVTGWVSQARAQELMQGCDVFVQTSLWEGLPVALMEAMAMGLPGLALPDTGNDELIEDGRTGLFCADVADFVTQLDRLLTDASLRRHLGDTAAAMIRRRYDGRRIMPLWSDLYTSHLPSA